MKGQRGRADLPTCADIGDHFRIALQKAPATQIALRTDLLMVTQPLLAEDEEAMLIEELIQLRLVLRRQRRGKIHVEFHPVADVEHAIRQIIGHAAVLAFERPKGGSSSSTTLSKCRG